MLPLTIPGRPSLGVPFSGSVTLEKLAELIAQLSLARADVRLELKSVDALRTLWLRRGSVIAASSSLPHESLLDQARRDGLIDGGQESELRLLRGASTAELLRVLRTRGHLRESEAIPLVERHTEQIALEALSEEQSIYRIAREVPTDDVALSAGPRSAVHILAESLRRSLTVESMIQTLGGLEAIPVALDSELDLRSLGFSERERRLIAAIDGDSTVGDLIVATGARQEGGLKALVVAKLLGLIATAPPAQPRPPAITPELDVRRLEAKFEAVQDADYFSVLGLSRTAGSDEVQRAFQLLAAEFHPLKFAGHPDAALQHRAQVVHDVIAEAARALQDDQLRQQYARHLLD